MDPDESANYAAKNRNDEAAQGFLSFSKVANQGRGIHANKGDEGAEVERFGANFVGATAEPAGEKLKNTCSCKGKNSDQQYVVTWHPVAGIDDAKKRFGERIAASHSRSGSSLR